MMAQLGRQVDYRISLVDEDAGLLIFDSQVIFDLEVLDHVGLHFLAIVLPGEYMVAWLGLEG